MGAKVVPLRSYEYDWRAVRSAPLRRYGFLIRVSPRGTPKFNFKQVVGDPKLVKMGWASVASQRLLALNMLFHFPAIGLDRPKLNFECPSDAEFRLADLLIEDLLEGILPPFDSDSGIRIPLSTVASWCTEVL